MANEVDPTEPLKFHVFPEEVEWNVIHAIERDEHLDETQAQLNVDERKQEAIKTARNKAKQKGGKVVIHNVDGTVDETEDYS